MTEVQRVPTAESSKRLHRNAGVMEGQAETLRLGRLKSLHVRYEAEPSQADGGLRAKLHPDDVI